MANKDLISLIGNREVWVTGKGGIGKTTVSAALSLKYARAGEWVLAFDVDGYHSMPDALNVSPHKDCRFRIPENEVFTLYDEPNIGLDLDLCLVSPGKIVEQVRQNRKTSPGDRTKGMSPYFKILHLYDVLEQLGTLVASEDLAALCLMSGERAKRLGSPEIQDGIKKARFIYDNQSSNATIELLERAKQCVERIRVMKKHRKRWSVGSKLAGWPDLGAFVRDDYVDNIDKYVSAFENFRDAVKSQERTVYVVASGARKTELDETQRLVAELKEKRFPVEAVVVNRLTEHQRPNLESYDGKICNVPIFTVPDLPVFESSRDVKEILSEFLENVRPLV